MRRLAVIAILCTGAPSMLTAVPAFAGGEAAKLSTASEPAKGSHENRTYISPDAKLSGYRAVLILDPTMDTTAMRSEKVDIFLLQLKGIVRSQLRDALEGTNRFKVVTFREEDAKAAGKYLVCRADSLADFGSAAARLLVGFGAGRSKFLLVESLEDPATNDIVIKYTGYGMNTSPFGWDVRAKMQNDAMTISHYFGGLVSKLPE